MEHPITLPPMLRRLWAQQAQRLDPHDPVAWMEHVATQAARWGADQELEACVEWLLLNGWGQAINNLRAARRPKPPSLAEQALEVLKRSCFVNPVHENIIRHALERLQELEKGNE